MHEGRKALARPALPDIPERIRWRGEAIAVFGREAERFGRRLCEALRARGVAALLVRVELRRAEAFSLEGDREELVLHAHPEALVAALAALREPDAPVTVGVGVAFAAAVQARLSVWIRGGETSLSPVERALVREARLVLEEARDATAEELAARLAT